MDDVTTARPAGPAGPRIKLLIVDDDPLVRSGLGLILGGAKSLEVVAQAANGRDGLAAAAEHKPDVVLMDIRMPVMDGIEATATLVSQPDPPRVIVLTTFDADDYVLRALAVGRGLSNAEIAGELYLSVPTVKAHIGRLFQKLEVENRVQIALCVHDAGLASG
jgi:DNA-binding NarL/FixJ family response regulator